MQMISSRDNPLVKKLVSLMESRKERSKSGQFVIEGLRLCKEAVISSVVIQTVLVTNDFVTKHSDDMHFFEKYCDDIKIISDSVCSKLGDTVASQGIFCLCETIPICNDILGGKFIVLENLQDPGNVGTIIRTAEAFGIDAVILLGNCVDIYNPKVLRSTMGTAFRIPVYHYSDIDDLKNELKKSNIKSYAAILNESSKKLSAISFAPKSAVFIGNEANGLSEKAKTICDESIFIEMSGKAESLNAAVAASVIMWEMQK